MIIGISGKYCSGKSTLSKIFIKNGFVNIDVDVIGHAALDVYQKQIITKFNTQAKGVDILSDKTQKIDRKKLSALVFSNKNHLITLEAIVHPWIKTHVHHLLLQNPKKNYVICAALLHKIQLDVFCNTIIIVKTPFFMRMVRAYIRDSLSFKEIIQRIKSQKHIINKKILKTHSRNTDIHYVRGVHSTKKYENIFASYLLKQNKR